MLENESALLTYGIDTKEKRRDWVKKRFMDTLLFTCNNSNYLNKIKIPSATQHQKQIFHNLFRANFNKAYNWLKNTKCNLAKNADRTQKRRNPGGSELALIVQRMEADLWINGMLKTLINRYGRNKILYTIHDSILIFNPNKSLIQAIEKEFHLQSEKLFGIKMPLKIK
jgi:hypothetical protein